MTLDDIAEDNGALMCYTDKEGCCKRSREGEWNYPNGVQVRTNGFGDDFYRDRGPRVVRLHRRYDAVMPIGVYHCEIPNGSGTGHIYVGVYPQGQGMQ